MSEENPDKEVLLRLENLEERLNALSLFRYQSKQLRDARKKLLDEVMEFKYNEAKEVDSRSTSDGKRVQFISARLPRLTFIDEINTAIPRRSTFIAQKSRSLQVLLTNLHNWEEELVGKKSEIELLKSKRRSLAITQADKDDYNYEQRIVKLENERDELNERILSFVLLNISEGKTEYKDLITQLEYENAEMEDRMLIFQKEIQHLKDNNLTLVRENERLRDNVGLRSSSIFLKQIEDECKDSDTGISSIFIQAIFVGSDETKTPSNLVDDMLLEDELSTERDSADSFKLDSQMATWKMDEKSLQRNVKRIAQDLSEMEIVQAKLNLIKRYVHKHGTKYINKNTLIDPAKGYCTDMVISFKVISKPTAFNTEVNTAEENFRA